jgi:dihydroneopterin aldolase
MNPSSVISLDPKASREADRIIVFLRDCRIELSVGYHPYERLKPQPVIVTIEVEAAVPHHYQDLAENSLDRVIDYSRLYQFLTDDLPRHGHITLLETMAEKIIAFCFEDCRIAKVRVRLEKPEMYQGKAQAGIELTRTRPGMSS